MRSNATALLLAIACSLGVVACDSSLTAGRSPAPGSSSPTSGVVAPSVARTALDEVATAAKTRVVVDYKPIDLATLPEPIGTKKMPTNDWTGMPLVQPTDGGMPFEGFVTAYGSGAIPAVSSLGARSLRAAAEAQLPATKGTLGHVLTATMLPVVRDWASDAVMIAATGVVDNGGIGPVPTNRPGVTVPAVGWIAAFQSVQRNEALLFSVDETQTRVLKLTFATDLKPIRPGVSGATTDSDALMATVTEGIRDLRLAMPDSTQGLVPPQISYTLGSPMITLLRQRALYAEQQAASSQVPERDTGLYPDSRWAVLLHREMTDETAASLVWYVQFQPGPSSQGTGGVISELFGGAAKVDAKSGKRLMLVHPWRSNPKAYQAGPLPSRAPGPPPPAVPTPTPFPPGFAPMPSPPSLPSPTPLP